MKRFILITGAIVYVFFILICFAANAQQAQANGPIVHVHSVKDFRGKVSIKDTSFRLDSSKMRALAKHNIRRFKNQDFAGADSQKVKHRIHQRVANIRRAAHHLMNADSISINRRITFKGDSMIRDIRRIVYFKPSPSKNYVTADTVIKHDVTVHKGMKPDVSDITNPEELYGNMKGDNSIGNIGSLAITDLNIYPNPNSGQFKLSFTLPDKAPVSLKITDMEGKTVWKGATDNFSGTYNNNIDLSTQPKGVYILEIMQNNKTMLKKLVVN